MPDDPDALNLVCLTDLRTHFDIHPGRPVVFGRGGDVRLEDILVSRRHCRIEGSAGRWAVTDLGSRNGTFVNGTQLKPDEPHPLRPGDTIRAGPLAFLAGDPPRPAVVGAGV